MLLFGGAFVAGFLVGRRSQPEAPVQGVNERIVGTLRDEQYDAIRTGQTLREVIDSVGPPNRYVPEHGCCFAAVYVVAPSQEKPSIRWRATIRFGGDDKVTSKDMTGLDLR